ncbi:carbon-nitrogen hydrolase family protein [Oleispirillum naphthae]|uniref:carbon-nitrogen hydrolase family protein n=1 Tax=Oleispirillum naphthae TaxID=2838853 RepID=UPI0030822D81
MRIALLHLDLAVGSVSRNLGLIVEAASRAADAGADWILTPEVALQGYFFTDADPAPIIPAMPGPEIAPLSELAQARQLTLFLGCAERDAATGLAHNSCVVLGPEGAVLGRHRKLVVHGQTEAWARPGAARRPIACNGVSVGALVCADMWYAENPAAMAAAGAEVLTLAAAWPPGPMGPNGAWERASAETGLPVFVCNQTGRHRMDMTRAESAVITGGARRLTYSGADPAILLFDWDKETGLATEGDFRRIPA